MNPRWIVLVGLYLLLGTLGAAYLWGSTAPGTDLETYRRAGEALWTHGDPYRDAALFPEDYRYRYPPLLAMVIPLLGWPPLWFTLMALATAVPILVGYRRAGPAGLLPAALLVGAWGQQLVNGNVQAVVVALLAVVPVWRIGGAVGLALATMLKLHPALAVVWYVGRRDWRALAWYAGAAAVLTLIQLPWLGPFMDFYLTDAVAIETIPGMSLRVLGFVPWLVISGLVAVAAIVWAPSRYGWLLATLLQLVALPRILLVNLALLLAAPLPRRADRSARQVHSPVSQG